MKLKQLSAVLLCAAAFYATNGVAADLDVTNELSAGYDLQPGKLQTVTGGWFSTKNKTCKVRIAGGGESNITMLAMKKRVIVNGNILNEADNVSFIIHTGDVISYEIDRGGKLGLTNNGDKLVNLLCK